MQNVQARFRDAVARSDWPAVLVSGRQLRAQDEVGNPPGVYALWMEIAAGSLGYLAEASRYSRWGLKVADPGSLLEAELLANGTYTALLCREPARALRLAERYEQHLGLYSAEGRQHHPRVLYHRGLAFDQLRQYDEAAHWHRQAMVQAQVYTQRELVEMIRVDLALSTLRTGAPGACEKAHRIYDQVDTRHLNGRGWFVYMAVYAELAMADGKHQLADQAADTALNQAERLDEAILKQRADLLLLRARVGLHLGHHVDAMAYGLKAALLYEGLGNRNDRMACAELLRRLCPST